VTAALARSLDPEWIDQDLLAAKLAGRAELRQAVLVCMDELPYDALLYPVSRIKAPTVEASAPHNVALAPCIGLPARARPAGFTQEGLPVGMELLGRPWSEGRLLALGYAYEQAVHPRRVPGSTPPLAS